MQRHLIDTQSAFWQGAVLGGLLAFCYSTIFLALAVVPALFRQPLPFADILGFIVLFYTFGSVIGFVPATVIGERLLPFSPDV